MSSISRSTEIAAAKAATRASLKEWQFINFNEPKKHLDKDVISTVRAHAMRSVRRQQRLKATTQYQKTVEVNISVSIPAGSSVTAEQLKPIDPSDGSVDDEIDTSWSREKRSEFRPVYLGQTARRDDAKLAAECEGDGQRLDCWQNDGKDEARTLLKLCMLGDGLSDPFEPGPTAGCANSQVLKHFVTFMCVPINQCSGQKPPTKDWLPYAFQDSTLFLATSTFAEVHLEILYGNHNSPRALRHRYDSIKAVKAKLGDQAHALSDEAIGAVAMLAAIEGILGNHNEFLIHTKGLQRMVSLRGGLQNLGWGGVLHRFILWQDLWSSTMMASTPQYHRTPYCRLIRGSLPHNNPIFHEIGLSTELSGGIATCFQDMRYLSQRLDDWDLSSTRLEDISFTKMRTAVVHRLLSFAIQKPPSEMTILDYQIETCRLAALLYIKLALHMYMPLCGMISRLKKQLLNLINQGEANGTIGLGPRPQPASITWALFVGGIIAVNEDEEEWFALRLARGIGASGVGAYPEMEARLKEISWRHKLNTPTCMSLWRRVQRINAEYWAAQICDVAPRGDMAGPFYWYGDSEQSL